MPGSQHKVFKKLRKVFQRSRSSSPARSPAHGRDPTPSAQNILPNVPSDVSHPSGNAVLAARVIGQHEAVGTAAQLINASTLAAAMVVPGGEENHAHTLSVGTSGLRMPGQEENHKSLEEKATSIKNNETDKTVKPLAQKAKNLLEIVHSLTKRAEPLLEGTVAKLPFGVFNTLVEAFETYEDNNERAEKGLDQIIHRLQIVAKNLALGDGKLGEDMMNSLHNFQRNLQQTQQELETLKGNRTWIKIWTMDQATQMITDSIANIEEFTKQFSLQMLLAIQRDTSFTKQRIEKLHLESWPISHSAWYAADAGLQISRNKCTEGTRIDIP
ncbi:hypothetical protein GYMLUDRAFT_253063 [Collybiopsis luxurians FD-317 M1]|uniref:Uncharacterized protein n=1 Tax=Collybiopsis luxurians FD-317 M1 TaxID=944289 RepID=A0A0D0BLQ7_9AGAR|nr:hypothetical protein GYMLUDRAFT_253063 [Collybiopsis luxurians FD-317 M1]